MASSESVISAELMNAVCSVFSVSPTHVRGHSRLGHIMIARHAFVLLRNNLTHPTYQQIGAELGSRSHSTIISSLRKAQEMQEQDKVFELQCQSVLDLLCLSENTVVRTLAHNVNGDDEMHKVMAARNLMREFLSTFDGFIQGEQPSVVLKKLHTIREKAIEANLND
jgi:hypothetical protein